MIVKCETCKGSGYSKYHTYWNEDYCKSCEGLGRNKYARIGDIFINNETNEAYAILTINDYKYYKYSVISLKTGCICGKSNEEIEDEWLKHAVWILIRS